MEGPKNSPIFSSRFMEGTKREFNLSLEIYERSPGRVICSEYTCFYAACFSIYIRTFELKNV